MSHIDNLILQQCPDGVNYKPLGEVATIRTGSRPPADIISTTGRFEFFNGGVARSGNVVDTNTEANTITIPSRGSVGVVGYQHQPFWCGPLCYRIVASVDYLNTRFLFHTLKAQQSSIVALQQTGSIPALNKKELVNVLIPVPPLEVQREIVRILDTFTALEAELEAELEARRQQYAHYRDTLLSCPSGSRVPLGDLGVFIRGRRFTWSDVVDEGTPAIHYSEIYTKYGVAAAQATIRVRSELAPQLRFAAPGDVVIAAVGETVEDLAKAVAWVADEPVAIHDDTFLFRSELNPKFVSYCLQTADFHRQKDRHVARAKVKRISSAGLAQIAIPVFPLDEQERIVEILDGFDALVNDLSVGLPAELAARRRQYDYYRSRLLTFEEAGS